MYVNLFHKSYNNQHLQEVAEEMKKLGAPKIRAIWSEVYGQWMAVEGCHRLRAAAQLGLTPVIVDVTNKKTVTIQQDGENVKVKVSELAEELEGNLWKAEALNF